MLYLALAERDEKALQSRRRAEGRPWGYEVKMSIRSFALDKAHTLTKRMRHNQDQQIEIALNRPPLLDHRPRKLKLDHPINPMQRSAVVRSEKRYNSSPNIA